MSQELASTVLGYEQQLAKVRAQADRARTTAAQLQRERDEAQRALEVERTTLLAMRQDAENATQQLEAELARLREKGETVVGRALDDAALQAALAEEQSRVYVAEARAEEAAYELEQERAKFMRFHKEATAALEMLEAERQRSTQLETANRELQMLLQQAAQLQAEREAQPGNEGLVRQLQEKVAELAEVCVGVGVCGGVVMCGGGGCGGGVWNGCACGMGGCVHSRAHASGYTCTYTHMYGMYQQQP